MSRVSPLTWLQVTRAHFLGASLFPYAAAVAVASTGVRTVDWVRVAIGALALALVHLGANLWNDYWDERLGADVRTHLPTTWSGGSRPTQRGLITPRQALWGSILLVASGCGVGIYLVVTGGGPAVFWMGVVGVALALGYSAPPARLAWRGCGEAAVGLAFGPVVVFGACWLVAGELTAAAVYVALGAGLMTTLVLLVNEFPDRAADRQAGKRTAVVRLGSGRAARLTWALWASAYASIGVGVWTEALPVEALLVLLTVPLAVVAAVMIEEWRREEEPGGLVAASALQVLLHAGFVLGLGWTVATGVL